jgi:hypothetical protein
MPKSGAWVSERVFTIPLAPDAASRSPGLVVFECSPLHGVNDEIEKYVSIPEGNGSFPGTFATHQRDYVGNTASWMTVHDYVR